MQVLIGLGLFALMLVLPARHRGSTPFRLRSSVGLVEMGVRFGVAMGGVYFALGSTPRGATLAGAVVGGGFVALMSATLGGMLAFTYVFRRGWWEFGHAWTDAGFSALRRSAVGRLREPQAHNRLVKALHREWEHQHRGGVSAAEFLAARRAEIERQLAPERSARYTPP